jgi:asparagine synthase (glutamine-hydrolysing)
LDRFVAFVWDPERSDSGAQVARWIADLKRRPAPWIDAFNRPGLAVLALKPPTTQLRLAALEGDAGVVVGTLFDAGAARCDPVARLDPESSARIVASGGRELVSVFWGSYVAFIRDTGGSRLHVVRDPCGATSCYLTRSNGVDVLCAFVDDIADLSGVKLSVDWESVGAFFLSNYLINERTGLAELTELLPGQRMTWRPGHAPERSWIWNPVAIARQPNRQSYEKARDEFRATTERCVEAWTRSCGTILVRMSGGLDSSIVAGIVSRTRTGPVFGLHLVGRGYESSELAYAREAATFADISLIEHTLDQEAIRFRGAACGPRLARPTRELLGAGLDAMLVAVCQATGAQSVFSGHGGDGIFLQRSIARDALTDYLRLNGPGRDAWNVAYDTSMLLQSSIWYLAKDAISKVVRSRRWDPNESTAKAKVSHHQVLTSEAIGALPEDTLSSVWLSEAQGLPNGKAEQLRNILALRHYHATRGHALTHNAVHPLISQPLVELSLRTPTYVFGNGGTDRALERDAFAAFIPRSVAQRFNKGFVNHSTIAGVVGDLGYVRDLVLNGACMRQGILDRGRVDNLLTPEQLLQGEGLASVMDLIAVESWLTSWRR